MELKSYRRIYYARFPLLFAGLAVAYFLVYYFKEFAL